MKMMLLTSAIAISLGATSAALAVAPDFSGIATEKTGAIAETRSTIQKFVTKNGVTCWQRGNSIKCIRMTP